MQDEELDEGAEPPQDKMIGLVSSVEKSGYGIDAWQADIVPLAIWNGGKWMSKESMLAKNNPLLSLENSTFSPEEAKGSSNIRKNAILEFYVKAPKGKGTKCAIDYSRDIKPASLPAVIIKDYCSFTSQIEDSYFDPDTAKLQSDEKIKDKFYCYFQNSVDKDSFMLGPFKAAKQSYGYKMQPLSDKKEMYAARLSKSEFACNTVRLPDGSIRLLNEAAFNLPEQLIDCMTSAQLEEWGRKLIQKTKDIDTAAADSALCIIDLLKAGLGNDRMTRIRLNRIANEVDWIAELIRESEKQKYCLVDSYIEKHPELQKDIEKRAKAEAEERMLSEMEALKEDFRKKELEELEGEKECLASELEALKEELASRQGEIAAKNAEREAIEAKTEEKRKALELGLAALEDRRNELEGEIAKLEEKKGFAELQKESKVELKYCVIDGAERKSFWDMNDVPNDEFAFEDALRKNANLLEFRGEILKSLAADGAFLNCRAMLVPNASWAYAFGAILGKAKVASIYPEYDWLHYSDFAGAGLERIWADAARDAEFAYILYIDGLNIASPESGLRPLLDAIDGKAPVLANTGEAFPENLKIMASLLPSAAESADERIGLRLRAERFNAWGAVSQPADATVYAAPSKRASGLIAFTPEDISLLRGEAGGDSETWEESKRRYLDF